MLRWATLNTGSLSLSEGVTYHAHKHKYGRRGRVPGLLKRTNEGFTRTIALGQCFLTIVAIGRCLLALLRWLLKHLRGITGAAGGC